MCGIAASLRLKGPPSCKDCVNVSEPLSLEARLDNSLDIIKHRGPDARGVWTSADQRVGLGHVRLSILDLSPDGNQPFHDFQDDIHAVVNGEIYNHNDYRELLKDEFPFQSTSDCEIVIALYKHCGVSFVSHLRGEFALVLWDSKRELLFSARDRFGIKSLYYTVVDNQLLISTEMKSFLGFGWKPEWDVQALREHGWQFGSKTFFKGVHKVRPAHYMVCKNFEKLEEFMYGIVNSQTRTLEIRSEEEMVNEVRERLLESVRIRLRADVPVGIYLSGGLDSSAIAGMVAHLIENEGIRLGSDFSKHKSHLQCFTVQFDKDSGQDESDISQRTANWLGVDLHKVYMDEQALASGFEDAVWYSESPLPDLCGAGKLALAKTAHDRGLKVVLTGEGSDEHFSGYPDYRPDYLQESDPAWPEAQLSDEERISIWKQLWEDSGATVFGETQNPPPKFTSRMLNDTHTGHDLAKTGEIPFASWTNKYSAVHPETALAESIDGRARDMMVNKWHPLHTAQYIWTHSFLPSFVLRYSGDNLDMVHHIESRPPFLHHRVAEYANAIPPTLKIRYDPVGKSFREKYILREAMKPFITEEIYFRQKKGYLAPTIYQENGIMHRVFTKLLTEENVKQLGFVDWVKTKNHLDRAFQNGDKGAFRTALAVAQFVVLGKRFGVRSAGP